MLQTHLVDRGHDSRRHVFTAVAAIKGEIKQRNVFQAGPLTTTNGVHKAPFSYIYQLHHLMGERLLSARFTQYVQYFSMFNSSQEYFPML